VVTWVAPPLTGKAGSVLPTSSSLSQPIAERVCVAVLCNLPPPTLQEKLPTGCCSAYGTQSFPSAGTPTKLPHLQPTPLLLLLS
jgi:hypothetical protein